LPLFSTYPNRVQAREEALPWQSTSFVRPGRAQLHQLAAHDPSKDDALGQPVAARLFGWQLYDLPRLDDDPRRRRSNTPSPSSSEKDKANDDDAKGGRGVRSQRYQGEAAFRCYNLKRRCWADREPPKNGKPEGYLRSRSTSWQYRGQIHAPKPLIIHDKDRRVIQW
jgi:hypothetical protein